MFDQYYSHEQKGGGDILVYVGRYRQRGHGLGNILGSLFSRILPFLKSFAPIAFRTGANSGRRHEREILEGFGNG